MKNFKLDENGMKIISVKAPIKLGELAEIVDIPSHRLSATLMDISLYLGGEDMVSEAQLARICTRMGYINR